MSLLPRIGWREWKIHRDHGVRDRAALASLDPRTARLVAGGVDVPAMQTLVEGQAPETPVADLGIRAKAQLARLEEAQVLTCEELARLDRVTASYAGSGLSSLPEHIDSARAALGGDPVYRRRGCSAIEVPRADVEVDVDMESIEEGAYLWGALLTNRASTPALSEYHAFVTWESLTPDEETSNSLRFWSWLQNLRSETLEAGQSFCAYCYNAAAENTYLRRLGLAARIVDDVDSFLGSDEWVDLLRVVDKQFITGHGMGLKVIAPIAEFQWKVDLPGGEVSMLRYDEALAAAAPTDREAAREWLLAYNRGDVEATLAIREWLEANAAAIAPIESVDSVST